SPIDGVVVEQLASRGQFVTSAVPSVLLRIANDRDLGIRAEVEAAHASELCARQRAILERSAVGPGELQARVTRIAPSIGALASVGPRQAETPPAAMDVFLAFDRPPSALHLGEEVTLRFEPCAVRSGSEIKPTRARFRDRSRRRAGRSAKLRSFLRARSCRSPSHSLDRRSAVPRAHSARRAGSPHARASCLR
ncbi:MAG: HlyD family secretion protein, partial [Hyphomicrobiales bacterium]|nr:HlyD family secretion protein [Hyphomicrobiales bacterium]